MNQETDRPDPESPVISSKKELRRRAAQYLIDHLEISASLMARCEALALQSKGDRTTPVFAAARILQVSADAARALNQVANGETRHRSIVEKVERRIAAAPDSVGEDLAATTRILSRRLHAFARDDADLKGPAPKSSDDDEDA